MRLPPLECPDRYRGLYIYDFGEWTAVGYTAEEIAILLEDAESRGGHIYKIHRAYPDGQLELKGVAPERFELESGLFFYRGDLSAARADYHDLCARADEAFPCRAFVHLADRGGDALPGRYVTAVIYPSEYDDEVARWMLDRGYAGGDWAEGGISHVTNYYEERSEILARHQIVGDVSRRARSADEVLAAKRRAVQR